MSVISGRLIRTVQPQMQQPQRYQKLKIYLVDSPVTEARCFPGGLIVFYRGLLDFVENEAQLVGIVGHELSHLDRGHALVRLRAWKQTQQQLTNPSRSTDPRQMMGIGMRIARTLGRPFRPEDETQADEDAVQWTWKSGYDPRELAKLFLRLHQRDGMQPMPFPSFLRSHPMPVERYRATRELAERLVTDNPNAEIYVGVENLKQRIPRDRKRLIQNNATAAAHFRAWHFPVASRRPFCSEETSPRTLHVHATRTSGSRRSGLNSCRSPYADWGSSEGRQLAVSSDRVMVNPRSWIS